MTELPTIRAQQQQIITMERQYKTEFRQWRQRRQQEKGRRSQRPLHFNSSLQLILFVHFTMLSTFSFAMTHAFVSSFGVSSFTSSSKSLSQSIVSNPFQKSSIQHFSYNSNNNNNNNKHQILFMGKGDGKKKRKKKSALSSSSTEASFSTTTTPTTPTIPPPQRVTSNSNLSVRSQIKWAKIKKAAAKNSGTAFRQTNTRVAYRKTLGEEEMEQAKLERQRKGQEPDWSVILNATAASPLVIIDGYNVIYQWPRLKKWMNKGYISKARDLLLHDLEELRYLKKWRVEVVFDGFGRKTKGPLGDAPGSSVTRAKVTKPDQQASKQVTANGIRVVYSGVGASADAYIEKRCTEAKQVTEGKLTGSLIVATNDAMIRTVASSAGALCMSSDRMVDELKAARQGTMFRVEAAVAKVNGHDVRPAKLHGITMPNTFTKGSVIIEDKRKRKKPKKKTENEKSVTLDDLKKGTTSLPSWAIVPPSTE